MEQGLAACLDVAVGDGSGATEVEGLQAVAEREEQLEELLLCQRSTSVLHMLYQILEGAVLQKERRRVALKFSQWFRSETL